jgi:hypothetical protein
MRAMSGRRDDAASGPEEARILSDDEDRETHDNLSEPVGAAAVDEDEQSDAEMLELDQTELEELGLTLDDPHQPESE